MTTTVNKVKEFLALYDELKEDRKTASKELSSIDSELSDWYHRVEGIEIKHISESHTLIKEVKHILSRRRDIKINSFVLSSVVDNLDQKMDKISDTTTKCVEKHISMLNDMKNNANN